MKDEKLTVMGSETYQEHQLVMLPTDKDSLLYIQEGILYYNLSNVFNKNTIKKQNQYLYLLSNEEIKEGDWYLTFLNNSVIGEPRKCEDSNWNFSGCKKIIATTDESLKINSKIDKRLYELSFGKAGYLSEKSLPRPSNDFLQAFVKAQGKGFGKVLVENERLWQNNIEVLAGESGSINYSLKIAQDNAITIKPVQRTIDDLHKECLDYLLTQVKNPAEPMNNLISFDAVQMALLLMVDEIKRGRVINVIQPIQQKESWTMEEFEQWKSLNNF